MNKINLLHLLERNSRMKLKDQIEETNNLDEKYYNLEQYSR